ncbi:MAG TPA: hypothetical protein VIS96_00920 [Terrimicrobiaceae bacterium]
MISRALILAVLTVSTALADFNSVVLEETRTMPKGGGYSTTLDAHRALASSVDVDRVVRIQAEQAMPGYCSGATYLVFLKTLQALQDNGAISLSRQTWNALVPRLRPDGKDTLPDGEGIWGRWNANGPGTARLFHKLGLGRNFTDFSAARPGDFLKIFWTDAVGKKESGHSVVFLGLETVGGVETVRFWSSNRPGGFGESAVPRKKIARAIFSRLENPGKISGWTALPKSDAYLAKLLRSESSFTQAARMSGVETLRRGDE